MGPTARTSHASAAQPAAAATSRYVPSQEPTAGDPLHVRVRLLDGDVGRRTTLDGAWWPRSRSLVDELPALVRELHRRGIPVTRASYSLNAFDVAPHKVRVDGTNIHLGWFASMDPHLLALSGNSGASRWHLLVIPPETDPMVADRAEGAASSVANTATASSLLAEALAAVGAPSYAGSLSGAPLSGSRG